VKILYVSQRAPYPIRSGGQRRTEGLYRLAARNHRVRLLCYTIGSEQQVETESAAREFAGAMCIPLSPPGFPGKASLYLRSELRQRPYSVEYFDRENLRDAYRVELERFRPDIVHVYQWHLAVTLPETGVPIVVDFCDWPLAYLESAARFRSRGVQALLRHEGSKVLGTLARLSPPAASIAISEKDARCFRELDGGFQTVALPMPVAVAVRPPARREPLFLLFGDFDYPPNRDALEWTRQEILPLLRRSGIAFRLRIAGRSSRAAVAFWPPAGDWEVLGEVESPVTAFEGVCASLVPVRYGTGISLKVVESLAAGIPVVTTSTGARGMDFTRDEGVRIGETASQLVSELRELVEGSSQWEAISRAAQDAVARHFSPEVLGERLDEVYAMALARLPQ
jgi:glycosyltransferase involved in cell wall biosynthesis